MARLVLDYDLTVRVIVAEDGVSEMDSNNENQMEFPFEIMDLEQSEALMKYFTGEPKGFVRVGPKSYFFPQMYKEEGPDIYNMPIRPTDIFISGYPRSGTTWLQQLVWLVSNDLNYAESETTNLLGRVIYLEAGLHFSPVRKEIITEESNVTKENVEVFDAFAQLRCKELAKLPSPRIIKTHIPLSLLSPQLLDTAKMVYIARDPRDVAVSFYHLNRSLTIFKYISDFKTFWNYFVNDLVSWTPYFGNLKEAWNKRNSPNMLFLFYEDLLMNSHNTVRSVCNFFNKQYSDEQIIQLCEYLKFDNFKKNKSINMEILMDVGVLFADKEPFIRKGIAGGWREYFDEDMTRQAERWIADNLRDTDLRFPSMTN